MKDWEQEVSNQTFEIYCEMIEKFGPRHILGVFPYGSMNYGLYIPGKSDVDVKVIYVPSFEEIMWEKPMSKELHLANGAHAEVKDVREMVGMWKKQNINFVEVLFTEYAKINPKYSDLWKFVSSHKEAIARYNPAYTFVSISGQTRHTLKQAEQIEDKTSPEYLKKISNCFRLVAFLAAYYNGASYEDCLKADEKYCDNYVMALRTGKAAPCDPSFIIDELDKMAEYGWSDNLETREKNNNLLAVFAETAVKIYDKKEVFIYNGDF